MRSLRAPIVSTGVFAVALAAGLAAVALSSRADLAERRQAAASVAAGAAFALESQLSRSLSATYALAAVIRRYGEVADFDEMAAEMLHHYGGISSLQLAPGAVVRRIHPLVGNEKALGHDLLADPARRDEARAAIESRQLVLAGPLALHQGGAGLVGRCPVFRPGPDGAERSIRSRAAVSRPRRFLR